MKQGSAINVDTGNKLKILRNEGGYSQQEIADKLNISKSKYCRLERNEAKMDIEELKMILQIYNISSYDFLKIKLPVIRTISFPKEMLDKLENIIEYNKEISDNWETNRNRLKLLSKALDPILEIRNQAFDLPDLNFSEIPDGTTTKTIRLDMRGEALITRCLDLQKKYYKVLFG